MSCRKDSYVADFRDFRERERELDRERERERERERAREREREEYIYNADSYRNVSFP